MKDYTIDSIIYKDLRIYQPKSGFRFSVDSPLLYLFVKKKKKIDKILDIGAGSGVLSVLMTKKFPDARIDAVEIDEEIFNFLKKTVDANKLNNKINLILSNIFDFNPTYKYDLVISNPPYRKKGTGRLCRNESENLKRFDDLMPVDKLMKYVKKVINYKGLFYLCYDSDLLINILYEGRKEGFEAKRIKFLHPDISKPAKLVFVEFVFQGGVELIVEPPYIQNSEEFEKILRE